MHDYRYDMLRPMDTFITAATTFPARMIRLWTAKLKGYNGLKEMWRQSIGNHCGFIIEGEGRLWAAEMLLRGGLMRRSLREYLRDPKQERIIAVVRHKGYNALRTRDSAQQFIYSLLAKMVDYDGKGSPGSFLGLCGQDSKKWYCSESVETVANINGFSWDNWQLNRDGKLSRIAPVEIQFGKHAELVGTFEQITKQM